MRTRCSGKRRADEKQVIAELYREGTLTVRVIGLERVGFNRQLHKVLIADCCRREGRKAERRREKRARRGTYTGPQHPAPAPIPRDVMDLLHPPALPVAVGTKRGRDEYEEDDDCWYGDGYGYGCGDGDASLDRSGTDTSNDAGPACVTPEAGVRFPPAPAVCFYAFCSSTEYGSDADVVDDGRVPAPGPAYPSA